MPDDRDQLADLERELVDLGRALAPEPPDAGLVAAVLDRLDAPGPRRPSRLRGKGRRRLALAVAATVSLAVGLVPPVRAAVLELLHLGGVVVREVPGPTASPTTRTAADRSATAVTLAEAQAEAGVTVSLPTVLGPPASVRLSQDRHVIELSWPGTVGPGTRLDVFAGSPDYGYLKQVWTEVTPTKVGQHEALWFGAPHLLQWVDHTGRALPDPGRVSGPTLVWVTSGPSGQVTYRLEGPRTLEAATAIAESAP